MTIEFNETLNLVNRIISVIVSIKSIIGCLFILLSLTAAKFPRNSHLYYVFWLAISDGTTALVILVDHVTDYHLDATMCTIIGN